MKKFIFFFLCLLMVVSFISCSKNIQKDSDTTITQNSNKDDSFLSDNTTKKTSIKYSNDSETTTVKFNGKDIKKVYLDINGMKVNIDVDLETISDLNEFESDIEIKDNKINNPIGTLISVYTDDTEETIGTVHLDKNKSYYLEYKNKSKGTVIIKISDNNV